MIRIRRSKERGHFDHGWLDTYHTFSFADYHDPDFMGFRALRVINEDRVLPGKGFGMHGHRDMEIVTVVLEGALEHKDGMGNGSVLRPGEVQHMTAGTGVMHSEFNPSLEELVHLYQIWIQPERKGLTPTYAQKAFPDSERRNALRLVASPDGKEGSLTLRADARLYAALLEPSSRVSHALGHGRHAWVQAARGKMRVNGQELEAGDGAALSEEQSLTIEAGTRAEALLFDLA